MNPVVTSEKLPRTEVWAGDDSAVKWAGAFAVYGGPGSVFVLPTPIRHDLANTGEETLRAVAFFAAAMFTQNFDNVMLPPKSHILGTPNRDG